MLLLAELRALADNPRDFGQFTSEGSATVGCHQCVPNRRLAVRGSGLNALVYFWPGDAMSAGGVGANGSVLRNRRGAIGPPRDEPIGLYGCATYATTARPGCVSPRVAGSY